METVRIADWNRIRDRVAADRELADRIMGDMSEMSERMDRLDKAVDRIHCLFGTIQTFSDIYNEFINDWNAHRHGIPTSGRSPRGFPYLYIREDDDPVPFSSRKRCEQ